MITLEKTLITINPETIVVVSINEKDEAGGTECLGAYKARVWSKSLDEKALKDLEVTNVALSSDESENLFYEINLTNGRDLMTIKLGDNAAYVNHYDH